MPENVDDLAKRVDQLETIVQALTARLTVEGQIAEFLLSFLFFERGITVEESIKQLLRNAKAEASVTLSDQAAMWWSDSAVLIDPMRTALLERVEREAARLRQAGEDSL